MMIVTNLKEKIFLLLTIFTSTSTLAQLEEIVVTAQMRGGGYYDMPAVTLKNKADFLVQNIQLINDSRSPDLRRSEIIATIESLMKASKKIKGIELSYGDGFLTPVNLDDNSLQIIADRNKTDTSYVNIFAKVALLDTVSAKKQIFDLREFIANAELLGRTEVIAQGDIGLSIIGPEQYRYEIIKKISEENKRVASALGKPCGFSLSGLQNRVEWERSGVDELTLYIGYESKVVCD